MKKKWATKKDVHLDDSTKLQYWLNEWTNEETGTTFYVCGVRLEEKRRSIWTVGRKHWHTVESEREEYVEYNKESLKENFEEMRKVVMGEEEHPLDAMLHEVVEEIEQQHGHN